MAKAKKPKHIAVAGNIGAGKTTLTEMLSKHYKWIPQFEDVDHNPYLNDFYEDMPRWKTNPCVLNPFVYSNFLKSYYGRSFINFNLISPFCIYTT